MGHRIGLSDGYGKLHLARITDGAALAVGDELHGARAALGFHFLVAARSGQRLSADFLLLRVSRQAMLDHLHPGPRVVTLAPRPRLVASVG